MVEGQVIYFIYPSLFISYLGYGQGLKSVERCSGI
jgi:hypothetical protein